MHSSKASKASEVESAIKHHITVNLEEDPEYYKSLSLRLRDIIIKNAGNWERQLELLLDMVDNIDVEHQKAAQDVGLTISQLNSVTDDLLSPYVLALKTLT
jgi:type I restriction enzyme R subunit